jgi:hypothetical protein
MPTHIHARTGILTHALSTLQVDQRAAFHNVLVGKTDRRLGWQRFPALEGGAWRSFPRSG